MKKSQVLKLVPETKALAKELKTIVKDANRLENQITTLENKLFAVQGVTIVNGFPVRVTDAEGHIEIWSACDESSRYATVDDEGENEWSVFGYFSPTESKDLGIFNKKTALSLASHFVATGKVSLPKPKATPVVADGDAAPKKRGRPKKTAA